MHLTELKNPLRGWASLIAIFGFVMTVSAGETTYSVARPRSRSRRRILCCWPATAGGRRNTRGWIRRSGACSGDRRRETGGHRGRRELRRAGTRCGGSSKRLAAKAGIERARLVIASTHTHSAPTLTGYAPVVWDGRATPEQKERVAPYTASLTGQLVDVVLQALDARRPAKLAWGQGRVGFGGNRRCSTRAVGPASDMPRKARWITACPCSSAGDRGEADRRVGRLRVPLHDGRRPQLHGGDWAGFASQQVEEAEPGAVARPRSAAEPMSARSPRAISTSRGNTAARWPTRSRG